MTTYSMERERAEQTLEQLVKRLRNDLNDSLRYSSYATKRIQELAAVYVPAQLALLEVLKAEREEQPHERTA